MMDYRQVYNIIEKKETKPHVVVQSVKIKSCLKNSSLLIHMYEVLK